MAAAYDAGTRALPVPGGEREMAVRHVHDHLLARHDVPVQQPPGQLVVHLALDGAAHRPGAELRLVAVLGDPVHGGRGELQGHVLGVQPAAGLLQLELGDLAQFSLVQLAEDDDLVDPVQELGTERLAEPPQQLLLHAVLLARSRNWPRGRRSRAGRPAG